MIYCVKDVEDPVGIPERLTLTLPGEEREREGLLDLFSIPDYARCAALT